MPDQQGSSKKSKRPSSWHKKKGRRLVTQHAAIHAARRNLRRLRRVRSPNPGLIRVAEARLDAVSAPSWPPVTARFLRGPGSRRHRMQQLGVGAGIGGMQYFGDSRSWTDGWR